MITWETSNKDITSKLFALVMNCRMASKKFVH